MMFGRKKKDNNPAEEMEQVVAEQGQEDNDFGPFDGDTVNFEDFDFSDFSDDALDLGSMVIPVPRGGGVIVEMGPEGPQMIHLQVDGGRLTPVAFAAPRNGDLWAETIDETVAGMTKDGLEVHLEDGPWGQEICAVAGEGQMRIIGANGPRWMFRMTLAGEKSKAEDLALIAREIVARTFIRRGNDPIPAGQALPVLMPPPLQEQMEQQLRQMEGEQNGGEQQ
ncbi:DUF3710 domain-containing protein [Corynebacterium sp. c9Ua_112]|uniref:DUF3710 domain-containing protein n=1 Tax=Corynebacterium macclintockiae TaxID=2913501 RepID=A0A9X3M580_9CORY|nr:DUF3710 domain-containing protein [Corynebacterium macclintockiae]MCZ9304395.1 DUF3710 domain-containing protein [Corynebacterium macclintockiae]